MKTEKPTIAEINAFIHETAPDTSIDDFTWHYRKKGNVEELSKLYGLKLSNERTIVIEDWSLFIKKIFKKEYEKGMMILGYSDSKRNICFIPKQTEDAGEYHEELESAARTKLASKITAERAVLCDLVGKLETLRAAPSSHRDIEDMYHFRIIDPAIFEVRLCLALTYGRKMYMYITKAQEDDRYPTLEEIYSDLYHLNYPKDKFVALLLKCCLTKKPFKEFEKEGAKIVKELSK